MLYQNQFQNVFSSFFFCSLQRRQINFGLCQKCTVLQIILRYPRPSYPYTQIVHGSVSPAKLVICHVRIFIFVVLYVCRSTFPSCITSYDSSRYITIFKYIKDIQFDTFGTISIHIYISVVNSRWNYSFGSYSFVTKEKNKIFM